MNNFILLQTKTEVVGAIFYDENDNYVYHITTNCGCSARSYIDDSLAGLPMSKVLARLKVTKSMTPIVAGYVGDPKEAAAVFF